jgi:hypothetical protein
MTFLNDMRVAYGVLVVGIVAVLISILIDPLRGYSIHMATSQIIVLIVGIVLVLVGAYLAFVRKPVA